MKKVIIVDMDGTLSDVSARKHFVEREKKDWESFYSNMKNDKPRLDVVYEIGRLVKELNIEEIFIITSRREFARAETMEWLNSNIDESITDKISHIYMREDDDMRADIEVKKEIYDREFKDKYDVVAVFEDRPRIIRMYRELGLNVVDVGDQIEF